MIKTLAMGDSRWVTYILTRDLRVSSRSLLPSQSQQEAQRKKMQQRRMYRRMLLDSSTSASIWHDKTSAVRQHQAHALP